MAKDVLILIHGVGEHKEGWSKEPIETLVEASKTYDAFTNRPLKKQCEFVEIRYDDIFDKILKQWETLSNRLKEAKIPGAPAPTKKISDGILELTEAKSGEKHFYARSGLDTLLYSKFAIVKRIVILKVATQLLKTRMKFGESVRYSIVAHSLGTRVIHDTLDTISQRRWLSEETIKWVNSVEGKVVLSPDKIAFLRERYGEDALHSRLMQWDALFMLANVVKAVPGQSFSSTKTLVKPPREKDSALGYYANVYNKFDPIAQYRPFRLKKIWPGSVGEIAGAVDIELEHVHATNVHGFSHYLLHPAVHTLVFRSVAARVFTFAELKKAKTKIGNFAKFGKDVRAKAKKKLVAEISELAKGNSGLRIVFNHLAGKLGQRSA